MKILINEFNFNENEKEFLAMLGDFNNSTNLQVENIINFGGDKTSVLAYLSYKFELVNYLDKHKLKLAKRYKNLKLKYITMQKFDNKNAIKILLKCRDLRAVVILSAIMYTKLFDYKLPLSSEEIDLIKYQGKIFPKILAMLGKNYERAVFEDKCFELLDNENYKEIINAPAMNVLNNKALIKDLSVKLTKMSQDICETYIIENRLKNALGVFLKMKRKNCVIEEVYDIIGFRVLVETEEQCYHMLNVIKKNFVCVEGRIKDFISKPKPNGYRALHATILYNEKNVEIQVKTKDMHRASEYGECAHWKYKQRLIKIRG
ncbi:MAG: hypothetical protein RR140_01635 [Clostridia bacterium]